MVKSLDDEINGRVDDNYGEFEIGDKVSHKVFGIGTVISFNEDSNSYEVEYEKGKRTISAKLLSESDGSSEKVEASKEYHESNASNLPAPGTIIYHTRFGIGKIVRSKEDGERKEFSWNLRREDINSCYSNIQNSK